MIGLDGSPALTAARRGAESPARINYGQLLRSWQSATPMVAALVLAALAWTAVAARWIPMTTPSAPLPAEVPARMETAAADTSMAAEMPDSMATSTGTGMEMDRKAPGVAEKVATDGGIDGGLLYLAMWTVMMVAMMFPAAAPLIGMYARTQCAVTRRRRYAHTAAFIGAYLVLWAALGTVPLAVNLGVPWNDAGSALPYVIAGALIFLSVYQLSPYKNRCLRHCRSPFGFLLHTYRPGVRGAVRIGLRHGSYCVGCCWALFALMVVVGSMNIAWMAVIAAVLFLEKLAPRGEAVARATGVAAGGSAAVVILASAF